MPIKSIINMLPDEKRQLLMLAFEQRLTEIVKLPDGSFIGVNVVANNHIIIEETVGVWSIGRINDV